MGMAWPAARTQDSLSEPAIPADPLVGLLAERRPALLLGNPQSGRSHRLRSAVQSSGISVVPVSVRGIFHAGLIPMAIGRTLGTSAVELSTLAWMLAESGQGLVIDQADELLRNNPSVFREVLARFRRAGVGPLVAVVSHDPQWPEITVCKPLAESAAPPVPLPIGMVASDYSDLLASSPAALALSGPVFAFDPAWVRKALEDLADEAPEKRQTAVVDLLAELALRRVGYLDPDAAALYHVARRVPAGMSWSDCDAVLPESSRNAVELLQRFHLATLENDRLHATVRFPAESAPPLADIFQERWEDDYARRLRVFADMLADGARSLHQLSAEDIQNGIWLGQNALNPQTRRALFVVLPRLIAHCGDSSLALQLATDCESALRADRIEPPVGWTSLLRCDIALADANPTEAEQFGNRAVETFRETNDMVGLVGAQQAVARCFARLDRLDPAVDAAARALRTATKADWKYGQAESLRLLGMISRAQGDPVAVRDAFTYAAGLFDEIGNRKAEIACRIGAAEALQAGGWIPEAFESLAQILDDVRRDGLAELEPLLLIRLAESVRLSGDPHRAILIADAAREPALENGNPLAARLALQSLRKDFGEIGFGEPALACTVLERNLLQRLAHPDAQRLAGAVEQILTHFSDGDGPDFVGGAVHRAGALVDDAVDRVRSLVALWELPVESDPAASNAS